MVESGFKMNKNNNGLVPWGVLVTESREPACTRAASPFRGMHHSLKHHWISHWDMSAAKRVLWQRDNKRLCCSSSSCELQQTWWFTAEGRITEGIDGIVHAHSCARHFKGTEPLLKLLFPPVLFLLWHSTCFIKNCQPVSKIWRNMAGHSCSLENALFVSS